MLVMMVLRFVYPYVKLSQSVKSNNIHMEYIKYNIVILSNTERN